MEGGEIRTRLENCIRSKSNSLPHLPPRISSCVHHGAASKGSPRVRINQRFSLANETRNNSLRFYYYVPSSSTPTVVDFAVLLSSQLCEYKREGKRKREKWKSMGPAFILRRTIVRFLFLPLTCSTLFEITRSDSL